MASRRTITPRQRAIVFYTSKGMCFYCNETLNFSNTVTGRGRWEIEHLIGYAANGSNNLCNLAAAYFDCNRRRGAQQTANPTATYSQYFRSFGMTVRCKTLPGTSCCVAITSARTRTFIARITTTTTTSSSATSRTIFPSRIGMALCVL